MYRHQKAIPIWENFTDEALRNLPSRADIVLRLPAEFRHCCLVFADSCEPPSAAASPKPELSRMGCRGRGRKIRQLHPLDPDAGVQSTPSLSSAARAPSPKSQSSTLTSRSSRGRGLRQFEISLPRASSPSSASDAVIDADWQFADNPSPIDGVEDTVIVELENSQLESSRNASDAVIVEAVAQVHSDASAEDFGQLRISGLCRAALDAFHRDFRRDRQPRRRDADADSVNSSVDPDGLYAILRAFSPVGIFSVSCRTKSDESCAEADDSAAHSILVELAQSTMAAECVNGLSLLCDCVVECSRVLD